jgi:8-amino-7-oxononanoate synthase
MDHRPSDQDELRRLAEAGLLRRLRMLEPQPHRMAGFEGRSVINFSSNDYLGLAASEELKEAMIEGVKRFGVGAGASRLVCGNLPPHVALEEAVAQFKCTEAALAFSSGYATALGTIPALCGKGDVIILDKLSHASLIDAAKLSGATIRVFPHNNVERLEQLLKSTRARNGSEARILVVTESVFSMDGDLAPLEKIVPLVEQYDALLMVDEAHAVGVLGPQGRGLIAALGLEKRVALQMGTLSKALGVSGGYLAASRVIIDLLVNKARSLIYSTAPPPAVAFTAQEAIKFAQGRRGDALRQTLQDHIRRVRLGLGQHHAVPSSAILPLILGDERRAVEASGALLNSGYLIPAIRYPTVARGAARLRLTLSALHETAQVESLVARLHGFMTQFPAATAPALEESPGESLA